MKHKTYSLKQWLLLLFTDMCREITPYLVLAHPYPSLFTHQFTVFTLVYVFVTYLKLFEKEGKIYIFNSLIICLVPPSFQTIKVNGKLEIYRNYQRSLQDEPLGQIWRSLNYKVDFIVYLDQYHKKIINIYNYFKNNYFGLV